MRGRRESWPTRHRRAAPRSRRSADALGPHRRRDPRPGPWRRSRRPPVRGDIGDHRCRAQQPLEARDPGSEDGLLLEGLQVVVVAGDLTEGPRLAQAGGELDAQLMIQSPQGGTQSALSLTGKDRWRAWRRRIDADASGQSGRWAISVPSDCMPHSMDGPGSIFCGGFHPFAPAGPRELTRRRTRRMVISTHGQGGP